MSKEQNIRIYARKEAHKRLKILIATNDSIRTLSDAVEYLLDLYDKSRKKGQ